MDEELALLDQLIGSAERDIQRVDAYATSVAQQMHYTQVHPKKGGCLPLLMFGFVLAFILLGIYAIGAGRITEAAKGGANSALARAGVPAPWWLGSTVVASSSPCVDIVDSIAAGVDPKGSSWGPRVKSMMGKAVNGAQFWKDGHSGGVDILGVHGTEVRLPQKMSFWAKGSYSDENRYGQFRQFRWISKDKSKDYVFYFGHLENSPEFEDGKEYPAGTVVGYMTDGGQFSSNWLYFHTHLQIEPANKIDGSGDVDPEKWWAENCSGSATITDGGSNMPITGPSTISAKRYDQILSEMGSPMQGVGTFAVRKGNEYDLNAAVPLAFFRVESTYGKNPSWAGFKPDGSTTYNIGNIICAGYATCYGRFRDYLSWEVGLEDWYKLLSNEYVKGRGLTQLLPILEVYAPRSDNNNPEHYAAAVAALVSCWADESVPVAECERRAP